MLNGIKESKLTKLVCGLMLASMTLSFSGEIIGRSTLRLANNKPDKSFNKVLSRSSNNQKQEVPKASQVTIKQADLEQANPAVNNQVKPNTQNKYSGATNATTWKPATNNLKSAPTALPKPKPTVDLNLLARVIYAESRGEPLQGQVAVGAVLLNRLGDSRFPKNLSQIIFKQGEFCTVRDGQIWKTPNQQAVKAAHLAVAGWDPTGGALYFYNPAKTTSRWIWSRPIVNRIGNHIFAI